MEAEVHYWSGRSRFDTGPFNTISHMNSWALRGRWLGSGPIPIFKPDYDRPLWLIVIARRWLAYGSQHAAVGPNLRPKTLSDRIAKPTPLKKEFLTGENYTSYGTTRSGTDERISVSHILNVSVAIYTHMTTIMYKSYLDIEVGR